MVTGSTVKKMSKFDINDTVTLKLEDGTVQRYQIFGFVLHGGDHASSGHYVWACEMADRWAVFNDEEVEFVDLENILSPSNLSPYILVYTLQKN
ncbi:unnamed protein product [Rodentolepis nana]|nr:unnamed protein product [Rodentolepis nana]